jgi:hypothetical protein
MALAAMKREYVTRFSKKAMLMLMRPTLFMIGACAAFVSCMINKARAAGLFKTAG